MLSLHVTFRFHLKNFSKVNMTLNSAPCWLHGMQWVMKAGPVTIPSSENETKKEKFLFLGIQCEGVWGAPFWACFGIAEICLLPVNKNQSPHVFGNYQSLFLTVNRALPSQLILCDTFFTLILLFFHHYMEKM